MKYEMLIVFVDTFNNAQINLRINIIVFSNILSLVLR